MQITKVGLKLRTFRQFVMSAIVQSVYQSKGFGTRAYANNFLIQKLSIVMSQETRRGQEGSIRVTGKSILSKFKGKSSHNDFRYEMAKKQIT